ncbi:MFS transporter (plasmid) [Kovacikia minuta CCNUW1]|uniref:MFS transporter n=1 Tax=Kovacikia minuta TaxID=2931930 RepID=UPI001CCB1373|nr:MFS transporter [Kovacikia minuta]UBF30303.1 MFS transporter [Kovacikia minuta CCNUW1]
MMSPTRKSRFKQQSFWAITLTLYMVAYNVSVMPAIMPKIVLDLNSSVGYIQGILVIFSLVTASFAPTTENLCRFYGRTRVFQIGLILYGLGIGLTSLSPTIGALAISFSLLTGLAATPLISTPWALADMLYDDESTEQATLAMILASVLGGISGSLMGGYLASNFGWRWAFLPSLCVLLFVMRFRRSLPTQVFSVQQPIDWVGGLLSCSGANLYLGWH